jgi:hypothetical protein
MEAQAAPQWCEVEIAFSGPAAGNAYTDVDAWVIFGQVLKSGDRPPNYVPIEFDRYELSLLICAESEPAWAQAAQRVAAD